MEGLGIGGVVASKGEDWQGSFEVRFVCRGVLGLVVLALPGTLTSTRPDEDRVPSGPILEVLGPRNWASRSDSRAN